MNRVVPSWKNPLAFVMPQGDFIPNGMGRRYMKVPTLSARAEAFAAFGFAELYPEPLFSNFIGNHYVDGAFTHLHSDSAPPGFVHTRCNWMIKKPLVGGDPILGGNVVPVSEGDLWVCFASEERHGSTPITGGERLICSFGALIPRDQAQSVMEKIT